MATSNLTKSNATNLRVKARKNTRVVASEVPYRVSYGHSTSVSHNPRLTHISSGARVFEPAKVIILTVNPELIRSVDKPLNEKAAAAKKMFADYRKSH